MKLNTFYIDNRNKSVVFFYAENPNQKSLEGFIMNLEKESVYYDKIDRGSHFNVDYFNLIETDGELISVEEMPKDFFDLLFESKNLWEMITQCYEEG